MSNIEYLFPWNEEKSLLGKRVNPTNDLREAMKNIEATPVYRKPLIGRYLLQRACDVLKEDMRQLGKSEDEIQEVIERAKKDFDIADV